MAKKRKPAARKRAARKPAVRRPRPSNPDATVNALVILVLIVMVLGGLYFYVQNKKQAALFPAFGSMLANLIAPHTPPPASTAQAPDSVAPALEPATGSVTPSR
jgi:hypothetical protein